MKYFFLFLIKVYQYLHGSIFPPSCRFFPSCSHYSAEAISRHGVIKGFFLSVTRILRCNPFFKGGFDPVPDKFKRNHCG